MERSRLSFLCNERLAKLTRVASLHFGKVSKYVCSPIVLGLILFVVATNVHASDMPRHVRDVSPTFWKAMVQSGKNGQLIKQVTSPTGETLSVHWIGDNIDRYTATPESLQGQKPGWSLLLLPRSARETGFLFSQERYGDVHEISEIVVFRRSECAKWLPRSLMPEEFKGLLNNDFLHVDQGEGHMPTIATLLANRLAYEYFYGEAHPPEKVKVLREFADPSFVARTMHTWAKILAEDKSVSVDEAYSSVIEILETSGAYVGSEPFFTSPELADTIARTHRGDYIWTAMNMLGFAVKAITDCSIYTPTPLISLNQRLERSDLSEAEVSQRLSTLGEAGISGSQQIPTEPLYFDVNYEPVTP